MRTILLAVIVFFYSCGPEPESEVKSLPRSQVVVLCDLSNSSIRHASPEDRQQQLDKLKAYINQVPLWYDVESPVKFYPVSPSLISHQLGPSIQYDVKYVGDESGAREKVTAKEKQVWQAIDSLLPTVDNSCILLSIERAVRVLREGARGAAMKNELVIVSDMVESCATSGHKAIVMSLDDKKVLDTAIARMDSLKPAFTAGPLDLHVKIIMNSPKMDGVLNRIQEAWMRWFMQIGVQRENIEFYTSDPPYNEYNSDLR